MCYYYYIRLTGFQYLFDIADEFATTVLTVVYNTPSTHKRLTVIHITYYAGHASFQ